LGSNGTEGVRHGCAGRREREETGDFRCERCHERVHVTQGDRIPKCPNCGNDTFDTREHEPDTKG
jgi:Zn finger protein HypA/HybF involved in hydrogenase expression